LKAWCLYIAVDVGGPFASVGLSFWCRNPMLRFGVLPSVDVACRDAGFPKRYQRGSLVVV